MIRTVQPDLDLSFFKENQYIRSWLIVLLFFLFHLAYINTPFVNLEWVYREGSQYFLSGTRESLDNYYQYQANPLSYSYLSSWLVSITGLDTFATYRLLALIGGTILVASLTRFHNPWLLLIVAVNPLIWIYSGRAYSELLAAGFMLLAYNKRHHVLPGTILGASAGMLKYHAWPLLIIQSGISWLESLADSRFRSWKNTHLYTALAITVTALLFLLIYFKATGIWLYPEHFKNQLNTLSLNNWLNNFFSYGFYLSGMFFLTIPAHVNSSDWKTKASLLFLSVILASMNQNLGEMDLGSFEQLLGSNFILAIKIFGFWNFVLCCQVFLKNRDHRTLILSILLYIALLSLTRPAQRYLIFVIPFWAILICQTMNIHRVFWIGYITALLGLNLIATLYQISNAQASWSMAQWATENDISVDMGAIHPHVGNITAHDPAGNYKVLIEDAGATGILHSETVTILGRPIRSYILVRK